MATMVELKWKGFKGKAGDRSIELGELEKNSKCLGEVHS